MPKKKKTGKSIAELLAPLKDKNPEYFEDLKRLVLEQLSHANQYMDNGAGPLEKRREVWRIGAEKSEEQIRAAGILKEIFKKGHHQKDRVAWEVIRARIIRGGWDVDAAILQFLDAIERGLRAWQSDMAKQDPNRGWRVGGLSYRPKGAIWKPPFSKSDDRRTVARVSLMFHLTNIFRRFTSEDLDAFFNTSPGEPLYTGGESLYNITSEIIGLALDEEPPTPGAIRRMIDRHKEDLAPHIWNH